MEKFFQNYWSIFCVFLYIGTAFLSAASYHFSIITNISNYRCETFDKLKISRIIGLQIAHALTLLMPFLSASILILIVGSYRQQANEHCRQLWRWIRCKKRENKIVYNMETMQSIIAEQMRQRQRNNFSSNVEIF